MALTREPDFPEEIAQLLAAWSRCADGYELLHVLEASANMLIMAVGANARGKGMRTKEQAMAFAQQVADSVVENVGEQWERQSRPTDIPVHSGS